MLRSIISPDTQRENRVPPGQHLVERWPVLHHGPVQQIDTSKWRFKITGLVEEERELDFQEFMGLPMVEVFSDIHCVTRWSRLNNLWTGVRAGVVRDLISHLPDAKFVMVHGAGGFTTNLALSDFFGEDALFALKHDLEESEMGNRIGVHGRGQARLLGAKRLSHPWRPLERGTV